MIEIGPHLTKLGSEHRPCFIPLPHGWRGEKHGDFDALAKQIKSSAKLLLKVEPKPVIQLMEKNYYSGRFNPIIKQSPDFDEFI